MRRIAVILLGLAASAGMVFFGAASGGTEGVYEVRAIFDSGGFMVPDEEVRVAGAKVGSVASVDVTTADESAHADGRPEPGKAVIVLRIDDAGFHDFRDDASCLIRPQSLLGEKFVECRPTRPRAAGSAAPPPLELVPDGEPGAGQRFLPLESNGKAVDLDLVNNVMRQPYAERLRLILNDLGAGLAARGDQLAEVVRRADPALRETNEVLAMLGRQNRALARLASDSERVLAPLARERRHVSGFLRNATVAGEATAERRTELEAGLQRLPGFLRELRPTMTRLRSFSDQATPVFADLGAGAPAITRATRALGPFSRAATPALVSLGDAGEQSTGPLQGADPVIREVRDLAREAAPGAQSLGDLLTSLRRTDGLRFATELVFYTATAVNGFDQFGHFLRAFLPINNCVDYEITPEGNCDSNFNRTVPTSAPLRTESADRTPKRTESRPKDSDGIRRETTATLEGAEALFDYVLGEGGE